mgnify:CR=1 FL=1
MIKVIYGAKGTGKTKQMIDAANAAVATAKGHLIFITDTKRGMYDLAREIRFIDVTDFDVAGEAALCGFIKGVIAGNHDNEYVYIDGVMRIAGKPAAELAGFFYMLDKVADQNGLTVTVSVSAALSTVSMSKAEAEKAVVTARAAIRRTLKKLFFMRMLLSDCFYFH